MCTIRAFTGVHDVNVLRESHELPTTAVTVPPLINVVMVARMKLAGHAGGVTRNVVEAALVVTFDVAGILNQFVPSKEP
jgi:hypothetical protein